MHILFLSDNFPPETNAPAHRTWDHVREWTEKGHQVTVITCAPNFPRGEVFPGYKNRLWQRETLEGVEIIRVWTYIAANAGFAPRILDYLSFMTASFLAGLFVRRPDAVVATSPQFFTAVAGWALSKLRRRPFVFELRDLWPETILAVDAMRAGVLVRCLEGLARFLYRQADLMVPVTRAFERHLIEEGVAPERIAVVTNGIDPDAFRPGGDSSAMRARISLREDAFCVAYVGTLGLCHQLGTVLDAAAASRNDPSIGYVLMGDGADREEIRRRIEEEQLDNVRLLDAAPRDEALKLLSAADASLVLLRNSPVFETVIPSKIFEAMALEKPILLGVRGEAHRIVVDEAQCGLPVEPEDPQALLRAIRRLQENPEEAQRLGSAGRAELESHYRRSDLAARFLSELTTRFGGEATRNLPAAESEPTEPSKPAPPNSGSQ